MRTPDTGKLEQKKKERFSCTSDGFGPQRHPGPTVEQLHITLRRRTEGRQRKGSKVDRELVNRLHRTFTGQSGTGVLGCLRRSHSRSRNKVDLISSKSNTKVLCINLILIQTNSVPMRIVHPRPFCGIL